MEYLLVDFDNMPVRVLLDWWLPPMGVWALALILPLYYLVDATITLTWRALLGVKLWHVDCEYYHRRVGLTGRGHATDGVSIRIGNMALIALAVAALYWPWAALGGGVVVMTLLWRLSKTQLER